MVELRAREDRLLDAVGELLRSNDDLEAFAGRVAHDLRSPLTAVLNFLALVEGPLRGGASDEVRECVDGALAAARRMSRLVEDLLAYAILDVRPVLGPVALPELVRTVLEDLRVAVTESGAVVDYDVPRAVTGDATLLRQLLQNLVGNAIAHARPGRAPRVRITAGVEGATWSVQVADDGVGVPPEERLRVFDPFVRLAPGGSSTGGSGLGLATCARIVAGLGGTISVTDAPGGGAAFRAVLPVSAR